MKMKYLLLGMLLLFAACTSDSSKAQFLKVEAGYTVLLQAAANYVALPRCVDGGTKVCSEQKAVDQIRPAANSADASVQAAEDLALNADASDTAVDLAVQAAQAATASLSAIMAQYGIKEN